MGEQQYLARQNQLDCDSGCGWCPRLQCDGHIRQWSVGRLSGIREKCKWKCSADNSTNTMNPPDIIERVDSLLMMVYELQKLVDAMTDASPQLVEAMRRVKESSKELADTIPEM